MEGQTLAFGLGSPGNVFQSRYIIRITALRFSQHAFLDMHCLSCKYTNPCNHVFVGWNININFGISDSNTSQLIKGFQITFFIVFLSEAEWPTTLTFSATAW